jgi:hypothetical protein
MREHQEPLAEHPDTKLRNLRTETFTALMELWHHIDDRQRRTWLAWLLGRLEEQSLADLQVRLQKRGGEK